ncbi:hypothetical protein [Saccharopolyspora sp. 5N708]|uniref:hypothetical protein n=1 Tax=Saccharopolyspora sp. 5N708 TaxID=3457424 RepID=UPI003FD2607D
MRRAARGDHREVLGSEALAEADYLLDYLIGPDGPRFKVFQAIGTLHLLRRKALEGTDPRQEMTAAELAFVYLTPVFLNDPRDVLSLFVDELRRTGMISRIARPAAAGTAGRLADLGQALLQVYLDSRRWEVLEFGISCLHRAAYELTDRHDPFRPGYLKDLSNALQIRCARVRSAGDRIDFLTDLARAVAALREAVDIVADDHPERPVLLAELGQALVMTGMEEQDASMLRTALTLARQAQQLAPGDTRVAERASHVRQIYSEFSGDDSALDELLDGRDDVSRQHDPARPPHPDERIARLLTKAESLALVNRRRPDRAHGRDAVRTVREIVELVADGTDVWTLVLPVLKSVVSVAETAIDDATLGEVVDLLGRAVTSLGRAHPDHADTMMHLAGALALQRNRTHDDSLSNRVISTFRAAADATPDGDPDYPRRLALLGIELHLKAREGETPEEREVLREAYEVLSVAVDRLPEGDRLHELAKNAGVNAAARLMLIERRSEGSRPITSGDAAPRRRQNGNAGPQLLDEGYQHQQRYRASGEREALLSSIEAFRAALNAGDLDDSQRVEARVDLATALVWQAEDSGETRLWREAIEHGRAALREPRCRDGYRAEACRRLSAALGLQYQHTAEHEVLDEAIELAREDCSLHYYDDAVAFNRYGRIRVFEGTANLVSLLLLDSRAESNSLAEADRVSRKALRDCPDGHSELPVVLTARGTMLLERYQRLGRPDDLREATELLRKAGLY